MVKALRANAEDSVEIELTNEDDTGAFAQAGATTIKFDEHPESLDDVRVTLHHTSDKRVDVANEYLELDGDMLTVEHADVYDNLYADEAERNEYRIEFNWRTDE